MSQVKMLQQIPVGKIKPSPYQPRLSFNLEDIRGSIQRDGILVALTVRRKEGYYELVDGERRLRLAKELGYKEIPCDIIEVDDETARRLVWKVNTLRQDYTIKEKAHYFQKLQKQYGMSIEGIARETDYSRRAVTGYLNVFKLPEKYQQYVWDGQIGIADLLELEPLFNGGASTRTQILSWLNQRLKGSLRTSVELREALKPHVKELQEARVEAAQKAIKKLEPTIARLKTSEDYERAAEALKREATRRREEAMTPEERAAKEKEEKRRREEEERRREERDEEEKRRIAEIQRKALEDKKFLQQVAEKVVAEKAAVLTEEDRKALIAETVESGYRPDMVEARVRDILVSREKKVEPIISRTTIPSDSQLLLEPLRSYVRQMRLWDLKVASKLTEREKKEAVTLFNEMCGNIVRKWLNTLKT